MRSPPGMHDGMRHLNGVQAAALRAADAATAAALTARRNSGGPAGEALRETLGDGATRVSSPGHGRRCELPPKQDSVDHILGHLLSSSTTGFVPELMSPPLPSRPTEMSPWSMLTRALSSSSQTLVATEAEDDAANGVASGGERSVEEWMTEPDQNMGSGLSNSSTGKMVGGGNNTQRMMSHSEGLPRNKEQLGQQLFLF